MCRVHEQLPPQLVHRSGSALEAPQHAPVILHHQIGVAVIAILVAQHPHGCAHLEEDINSRVVGVMQL